MRNIPDINLDTLVAEQEQELAKQKRDRIGKLVLEKIQNRERIKEQILDLQEQLETVEATIANLRKNDWAELEWKRDSSEEA